MSLQHRVWCLVRTMNVGGKNYTGKKSILAIYLVAYIPTQGTAGVQKGAKASSQTRAPRARQAFKRGQKPAPRPPCRHEWD